MNVSALRVKVGRAREALREAEGELAKALISEYPIQPDDEITQRGKPFLVRRLWVRYGRVYATASPKNKNGEWSKGDQNVYDYLLGDDIPCPKL